MAVVKQVIIMRTKYKKEKGQDFLLRKGKLIAQGAHASSMWIIDKLLHKEEINLDEELFEWINTGFTKIVLQVETDLELIEICNKAKQLGLRAHLITDLGKTEFSGNPTITCLAIGPNKSENIDEITKNLKLY